MRVPIVLLALLALPPAGCRWGPAAAAPIDDARRAAIVAEQARRLALLERIDRSGTGTLRTRDEGGAWHEDQGDIRLLLAPPRAAAVRLSVLGETVAWLGCDESDAWVFSLRDRDDRWCIVGPHDRLAADVGIPLPPTALFDLLGLVPLPAAPEAWTTDDAGRPVVRTGAHGDRVLEITLDSLGLPARVRAFDEGGVPALEAELSEYQSIATTGVAAAALPRFPGRASIRRVDGDFELRLSVEPPPSALPEARWTAAFDFERLRTQLRPDRVEDRRPRPAGTAP